MDDPRCFLPAAAAARANVPELRIHKVIADGDLITVFYRGEVRIPANALAQCRATLDASGETK